MWQPKPSKGWVSNMFRMVSAKYNQIKLPPWDTALPWLSRSVVWCGASFVSLEQ